MGDLLVDNKNIYNFELNFMYYFSICTKITMILFFIGFLQEKPVIYLKFNFIIKFLLGLFLIYRFNSYRKNKIVFTELDRKICYSSGIYIIVISLGDYLLSLSYEIRSHIINYTNPFVDYIKNKTNTLDITFPFQ